MKIISILAILAFFLLAPFQVQAAAQSTDLNWNIAPVDAPPAQNNVDSTQAAIWRSMNGAGLPPLEQLNINVILADPIFQGLAIALMAGEIASLLISRMAVPVLYFMAYRRNSR